MEENIIIRDLVDQLNYYTKCYDEGNPKISDKKWDEMYFALLQAEKRFGIIYPDSPTQKVHYAVVNELEKVTHSHPMLSLNKTKDIDEMNRFINGRKFITMLKMDGLTCSLTYKDGLLVGAETRGNGIEGENILHNARLIKDIPLVLPKKVDIVVDGEIICTYQDFEKYSNKYANPRNFAAGSIRLLDAHESAMRNLSFIAWDLVGDYNLNGLIPDLPEFASYDLRSKFECLIYLDFTVVPWTILAKEFDEELIEGMKLVAEKYGYPIDGLVVKINDCKEYEACGRTDHHFKGGMAYKFYDEEYVTWLKNIEWTMGRTGVLTPVAIFNPVDTGDSIIERASLHNISIMKEVLGTPYSGQTITVCKMNDIIPQVVSGGCEISKADIEGLEFKIPTECPICGGRLEVVCEVDTEVLVCTNEMCEGKLVNRLDHFCGKKGLDIRGLSKATLGKLVDWGWVSTFADLYKLGKYTAEWIRTPGFGPKSVENIMVAIETSRLPKLENFICALGIPHVGKTLSKELTKYFSTYEEFRDAAKNKWDFTQIDGVAYEKASAIWNFDFAEADLVDAFMLGYDVDEPAAADNILDGLKFCITGRLSIISNREVLSKIIRDNGGIVVSSISKNVNYLINNDLNSNTAKNQQAKKLNIPIISETEILKMIGENFE